jgi:hypothetical protein
MINAWQAGTISTNTLAVSISGWVNHVRYGNTTGLRKKMLNLVPAEALQSVRHLD